MRASDLFLFLQEGPNTRSITIHPRLVKIFGGIKETVFITNLIQWLPENEREKEIYKTSEEIEEETGLTIKEQMRARKRLLGKMVIKERHARLEHRIYYALNLEGLDILLEGGGICPNGNWPNAKRANGEMPKGQMANSPNGISNIRNKGVNKGVNKISIDHFETFWREYPRKVAKPAALKAWTKGKCDSEIDRILPALKQQRQSKQWQQNNGQYIPHPATWLNNRRWEDAVEVAGVSGPGEELPVWR